MDIGNLGKMVYSLMKYLNAGSIGLNLSNFQSTLRRRQ